VTTTTLQRRCEAVSPANANTCSAGLCPEGTRCFFEPGQQSSTYVAAALPSGKCVCKSVTSTTIVTGSLCERVTGANAAECAEGLCANGMECRYMPVVTAANAGFCRCVLPTTTTVQGQERCESMTDASTERCVEGLCPAGYECSLIQLTSAANAVACRCVSVTTTTVQPRYCEDVSDPTPESCKLVFCRDGSRCDYYVATLGNQQVKKCVCAGGSTTTTTTTVPSNECASIGNPSQTACRPGICPAGETCTFTQYTTGNQQVKSCVCVKRQTTTTTTLGIVPARPRNLWNLFGLLG